MRMTRLVWTCIAIGFVYAHTVSCSNPSGSETEQALDAVSLPPGSVETRRHVEGVSAAAEFGVTAPMSSEAVSFPDGAMEKSPSASDTCQDVFPLAPPDCVARYVAGARFPNPSDSNRWCVVTVFEGSGTVDVRGSRLTAAYVVASCPRS